LKAKKTLGISPNEIPQPGAVNPMLSSLTRFQLAPAEGLLDVDDFLHGLANRRFPCTQYLRHGSDPAFTPEPDMVHDLVGHVPLLVDPAYASLIARMGQISLEARDEQLLSLQRFYWFGIEFGLLEESGVCKVFGSGLLSSYGETEHALSSDVEKRPFRLDEVVQTQFDPTRMQDLLFVIPSFEFLHAELSRLGELLSRNR
jgi:phenylalanine-4-hydroxylase